MKNTSDGSAALDEYVCAEMCYPGQVVGINDRTRIKLFDCRSIRQEQVLGV